MKVLLACLIILSLIGCEGKINVEKPRGGKYVERFNHPENIIEIHGDAIYDLREAVKTLQSRIDVLSEKKINQDRCKICGKIIFEKSYLISCDKLQIEQPITDVIYYGSDSDVINRKMDRDDRFNERLEKDGIPICERCVSRGIEWLALRWCELKK